MKFVIFSFFALFLAVRDIHGNDESIQNLKECLNENNIKVDIEKLKEHDDPKIRCILACVMEKEGILENGDIQYDLLKEDLLEDAEQLGEKKISEIVDYCGNLAKELTDVCDKTNLIGMCLEEELEKYNIKFEK
uniref:Odorant-binding protein 7 n=1 Tax=Chouioia cunea TaxID=1570515 RepID=A0A6B9CKH7_9HYME|nr:odorant-binding protein 7 [Chouioia cunea]